MAPASASSHDALTSLFQEEIGMEAKVFKTGDVVQLKSGGPKMTVKQYTARDTGGSIVRCQWFEGGKHQEASFPGESLDAVTIDGKP
jgi:uncharacterized protein YodC (DUF2158 family)